MIFFYGSGSFICFVSAILLLFFDHDYSTTMFFFGILTFLGWLEVSFKVKPKINELKHLNTFIYNQLESNNYFYHKNDKNSYYNKHVLNPRFNYQPFYKNKIPPSHINRIMFYSDSLEKENIDWELSDTYSCEVKQNSSYEIIGNLALSNLVYYSSNGVDLRYRVFSHTPWYKKLFPRKCDNIIYALKKCSNDKQKKQIVLISKNELCLFNIIYRSKKF